MPSAKYAGWSYPTHFLKSRGSVIRNTFLEYRTKKATHFEQQNYWYALLAINKANHMLNRLFSCSCSDTFYGKIIKKKVQFLKVYHFSISQYFPNVKVVVVQAVIA